MGGTSGEGVAGRGKGCWGVHIYTYILYMQSLR